MLTNLQGQGIGGISYDVYVSSSELNSNRVWGRGFDVGDLRNLGKEDLTHVRPVRAF